MIFDISNVLFFTYSTCRRQQPATPWQICRQIQVLSKSALQSVIHASNPVTRDVGVLTALRDRRGRGDCLRDPHPRYLAKIGMKWSI
jgi:hypothetical protein